jgi:hypothetical protein
MRVIYEKDTHTFLDVGLWLVGSLIPGSRVTTVRLPTHELFVNGLGLFPRLCGSKAIVILNHNIIPTFNNHGKRQANVATHWILGLES